MSSRTAESPQTKGRPDASPVETWEMADGTPRTSLRAPLPDRLQADGFMAKIAKPHIAGGFVAARRTVAGDRPRKDEFSLPPDPDGPVPDRRRQPVRPPVGRSVDADAALPDPGDRGRGLDRGVRARSAAADRRHPDTLGRAPGRELISIGGVDLRFHARHAMASQTRAATLRRTLRRPPSFARRNRRTKRPSRPK